MGDIAATGFMHKLDQAQRQRAISMGDRLGLSDPVAYELIWLRDINADLLSALRFILAFYEPGQRHLDTEAWKHAEAGARAAVAKAGG